MARGLAQFIAGADSFRDTPKLPCRRLPDGEAVWPPPHNSLYDFEATRDGAAWIDRVAKDALAVMRSASSHVIAGHHDWSAKNMRMGPDGIAVLYDWDAVFLDREAFVLGSAAAHFPVTWELPVPETPTRRQMATFIQDYAQGRGTALSRVELSRLQQGPRTHGPIKRAASIRSILKERIGTAHLARICGTMAQSILANRRPDLAAVSPRSRQHGSYGAVLRPMWFR